MFTIAKIKYFNAYFFIRALIGAQYCISRATRYISLWELYGEQIEKPSDANAGLTKEG